MCLILHNNILVTQLQIYLGLHQNLSENFQLRSSKKKTLQFCPLDMQHCSNQQLQQQQTQTNKQHKPKKKKEKKRKRKYTQKDK